MATRLATAAVTCSSLPNTSSPGVPPVTMSIRLESASIALVSTATPMTSSMLDRGRGLQRVVGLQPGQLDDLLHEPGEPVALGEHPAREPLDRLRVVARVGDRLGQQLDRADRRLELVADVGDEVAAYGLDPALAGAVLDQGQHQPRAERRDPGGDVPGGRGRAVHQQLGLADLAVAAYLVDQPVELVGDQLGAAHQPEGVRRRGGLHDGVGVVDDHRAAAQHAEHGRDLGGYDGLVGDGRGGLLAVADVPGEHGSSGDDGSEDGGEERLGRRVHTYDGRARVAQRSLRERAGHRTFIRRSRRHPGWTRCPT